MEPPSPVSDPALDPLASEGAEQSFADIKRSSARGGAISMLSQGIGLLLQLTSTIVLARLLRPAEYGVIAMVAAVTAFAGLFRDLGLSASTIQRAQITGPQLSTLYWINVAIGGLLALVTTACAPVVAWFYGRPELTAVTAVVSLNFFVAGFGTQPGALLTRQMRFGRIATANIVGTAVGVAISIGLAAQGGSYWALVFGGLATGVVSAALLNVLSGWRPSAAVKGSGVRSMLAYGAHITAFDVVNYFHRNLDNILIGRIWGADALGLYSRAYSLLMFPIYNIRGPLNAVAFPALSRLVTRPHEFKAYYRRLTSLIAFLSMPLMAFLFIDASRVIELALGSRWLGVAPIFAVLAVTGFVQPVTTMFGVVLLSAGLARRYLKLGIFNTSCMCAGFVVGSFYGPVGVAVAYGVVTYVISYPLLYWTFKGLPIKVRDFNEAVVRPALSSIAAAAAVFFIAKARAPMPGILSVAIDGVIFSLLFLAIFVFLPGGRSELQKLIAMKNLFRRADPVEA